MREQEINNSLKRAIDSVPLNMLEEIENTMIVKMAQHDEITAQFASVIEKPNMLPSLINFKQFAMLAVVFSIAIFTSMYYYLSLRIVGTVYMDINPSL